MSLNRYLEALTNAQSLEELWDMHCRKMASYGFDRLLYGFTRYRSGTSLGDPEDFVILPEIFGKDPMGPVVRQGDPQWRDIVQWVVLRRDLWQDLGWPLGAVVAQACHASTAAVFSHLSDDLTQEYIHADNIDHMHKVCGWYGGS